MEKKYSKNFIAGFILRVDFDPEKECEELYRVINSKVKELGFIQEEKREIDNGEVKVDLKENISEIVKRNKIAEYSFYTAINESRIILTDSSLMFETKKYTDFEQIKIKFTEIIKLINYTNYKRIGMRYVNQVPIVEKEKVYERCEKIIKPEIFSTSSTFQDKYKVSQHIIVQEFESKKDTNYITRLQIGIPSQSITQLTNKIFLIDIDTFTKNYVSKDQLIKEIEEIHEACNDIFEDIVSDDFKKELGGTDE